MTTQKENDMFSKAVKNYGYFLFNGFTHDLYEGATHNDYVQMFNNLLISLDEKRT